MVKCDNAYVNLGSNSIVTQVKEKMEYCSFMGCPCHLVHNIANHAAEALQKYSDFDVEDLCRCVPLVRQKYEA